MDWKELAYEVLNGKEITYEEALSILLTPDKQLLELLHGAYIIRHHYYGNKVKLNKIKMSNQVFVRKIAATVRNQAFPKHR